MKIIALAGMPTIALAATLAFVALPAVAQPVQDGTNAAAGTGLRADPNYNSNVGVTNDTAHEAMNDTSNGRVIDRHGQPNTNAQTMRSQQRHALGETSR